MAVILCAAKKCCMDAPHLLHRILDITTQAVTAYLNAQIEAGVDAVMVFDSWAGVLSSAAYQTFSLNYVKTVMSQLTRKREASIIPRILFSKGGGGWLEAQAGIDVDALAWIGRWIWVLHVRVLAIKLRYKAT